MERMAGAQCGWSKGWGVRGWSQVSTDIQARENSETLCPLEKLCAFPSLCFHFLIRAVGPLWPLSQGPR